MVSIASFSIGEMKWDVRSKQFSYIFSGNHPNLKLKLEWLLSFTMALAVVSSPLGRISNTIIKLGQCGALQEIISELIERALWSSLLFTSHFRFISFGKWALFPHPAYVSFTKIAYFLTHFFFALCLSRFIYKHNSNCQFFPTCRGWMTADSPTNRSNTCLYR